MSDVRLMLGDCREVLATFSDGSVDAVVCDPPAGIRMMGRAWDSDRGGRTAWVGWLASVMAECLRVAKPGSRALVWGLPRTSHWTGTAIEDAGWTIEDRITHHFGQGYPKHKSKLKPATEDWWLAIKSTGKAVPLNIDRCRIATDEKLSQGSRKAGRNFDDDAYEWPGVPGEQHPAGRWPANLVLSHVSIPVMRLNGHASPDTIDVVRRYFDGYVRVRELRGRKRHPSGPDPVRTTLLQSEVQGRRRKDKADARQGRNGLPSMQGNLPVSEIVGKAGSAKVLQSDVPQSLPEDNHGRGEPQVRHLAFAGDARQDIPDPDRAGCFSEGGGSSELEGRPVHERRVRVCDDRGIVRRSKDDGPSDAADARVHRGASPRDGDGREPTSSGSGIRPSQERREGGQLARESNPDRVGSPQPHPSGGRACLGGCTGRCRAIEGRECPLEVLACDVPPGWLDYFELTGEDLGCSPECNGECAEDCPVAEMDRQSGVRTSGTGAIKKATGAGYSPKAYGKESRPVGTPMIEYGDSGGVSRYFPTFRYQAKATRADKGDYNLHPTVKPTDLMRWLCRLVTPPGGLILDPFAGSGSTGKAAVLEGFGFIGIEADAESHTTAQRRIAEATADLARPHRPKPSRKGVPAEPLFSPPTVPE